MLAIPAIDLKGGRVVRLLQGKFDAEEIYAEEPHQAAKRYESEGASRLHVVDLDGALNGEPKNLALIEKILKTVRTPVELGGGIRSLEQIERYFEMGLRWAILGTKACLDEGFLKETLSEFGERVIIGVDARDGFVAVEGWTRLLPLKASDLAAKVQRLGGKTIIYTDIAKDGALSGPNLAQISQMCDALSMDVIASGGVGSASDLKALRALQKKNLCGVVIGKALYEKKITLKEAIAACS